jgi:hypothetical protein
MKNTIQIITVFFAFLSFSCSKHGNDNVGSPPQPAINYGDSVFYLDPSVTDFKVSPITANAGRYFGWPEGIDLDQNTGAINVSKSETGLRYKIFFVPAGGGDTLTTIVTISGINFLDGFYRLSAGDSLVTPLYNGLRNQHIPGQNAGSIFDEGGGCNSQGCDVNAGNGTINLASSVRNGIFGAVPASNSQRQFLLNYRIDDKSRKAANSINVKIYYFDTINDVPQDIYDLINSRQGSILAIGDPAGIIATPHRLITSSRAVVVTGFTAVPKPRPPCIFIIGH